MPKVKKPKGGWFIPKKRKSGGGRRSSPQKRGSPMPVLRAVVNAKDTIRNGNFAAHAVQSLARQFQYRWPLPSNRRSDEDTSQAVWVLGDGRSERRVMK